MRKLTTVWTEQVTVDNVWREYPRPNMVRESYINLNGLWDYAFCPKNKCPRDYDGQILVPFSPEAPLSGVGRRLLPDESLWYRRYFSLDPENLEGHVLLHFGAVDQYARVFVNGMQAGSHTGGYLPFTLDITGFVEAGLNSLTVMVRDVTDSSYHARGKQKLKPIGMFYTPQSGIWQTVWLECVPAAYVESYRLTPLYDEGSIRLQLSVVNGFEGSGDGMGRSNAALPMAHITVFDDGQAIVSRHFRADDIAAIQIPDFKSWSPEDPFLYTFRLQLGGDIITGYFAMRKFSVGQDKDGISRLFLNNRPYFHNGVLDQGYWPDGLYTAPCDQALIYDIETMKRLGFNMLRKHVKLEPLRWYYHCDRLGMIVWQDMVNGGSDYSTWFVTYLPTFFPRLCQRVKDSCHVLLARKNRKGREEFYSEMKATVDFLYNQPCVAMWTVFNEGWGQFDALKAESLLRGLDSTRTIDSASGWFDQGGGDVKSLHIYFTRFNFIPEHRPTVLSEFGGYALHEREHTGCKNVFGYRMYDSTDRLSEAYKALYEDKIIPSISKCLSASVYTQLSDVEAEINGLLTYDRRVLKINEDTVHRINMEISEKISEQL